MKAFLNCYTTYANSHSHLFLKSRELKYVDSYNHSKLDVSLLLTIKMFTTYSLFVNNTPRRALFGYFSYHLHWKIFRKFFLLPKQKSSREPPGLIFNKNLIFINYSSNILEVFNKLLFL